MTFSCTHCSQPITFNKKKHVSASGKAIPLDPVTEEPHNCPNKIRAYQQSTQEQEMKKFYPDNAPPPPESGAFEVNENNDEGYADKQQQQKPKKSMEQMHDENIAAWDRIAAAIERANDLKVQELQDKNVE
jgi:hypothetical protein